MNAQRNGREESCPVLSSPAAWCLLEGRWGWDRQSGLGVLSPAGGWVGMHGMGSPRVLGPFTPWPRNESRKKSSFPSLSSLKGGFQLASGSWEL